MPVNWRIPIGRWQDQPVFVMGGGTSVNTQNTELLRGRNCIAINTSYTKIPWADYLFFGDAKWWGTFGNRHRVIEDGYRGEIVTVVDMLRDESRLRILHRQIQPRNGNFILSTVGDALAVRLTSFTGGINLAVLLNNWSAPIVLLGADGTFGPEKRTHHHRPHQIPPHAPQCWDRHRGELEKVAAFLHARNVPVYNASPGSAWAHIWPVMTLEEAILRCQEKVKTMRGCVQNDVQQTHTTTTSTLATG